MTAEEIKKRQAEIVARGGEWTGHNLYLGQGHYTMGDRVFGDELKLRRLVQVVSDVMDRPINELRAIDLAALEGLYGIELARHGANVVLTDARQVNIEKMQFAKDVLQLPNIDLILDDVRNLSPEKYGLFDVVLCLGILYHLDAPDVFDFVKRMGSVCSRLLILDTHITERTEVCHTWEGEEYWGWNYREHDPNSTEEERVASVWSSIDNEKSFWFTRRSLYNLLQHCGFTTVYECYMPAAVHVAADRPLLVAIKGDRQTIHLAPAVNERGMDRWPELPAPKEIEGPDPYVELVRSVGSRFPRSIRTAVKRILVPGSDRN